MDMKCFEENITLIHKDLYRFIYSIARHRQTSEDILQNTLLAAFKGMEAIKNPESFKSWIFTIAKRESLAIIKRNTKEVPSEDILLDISAPRNEEESPEEQVLSGEDAESVVRAVNKLREELRQVLNLHYYNDLSFTEIAQVIGVNENTVRTWHMRAKKEIAEYLKAE